MSHPIDTLMSSVLENLKNMVDANTVIGEPINLPNGVSVIPVTKLSCGFGCGGGEYGQKPGSEKIPFGGATGGGISLQPLGFISVAGMEVNYTSLDGDNSDSAIADILVETVSKVADKFSEKKKAKAAAVDIVVDTDVDTE